MKKAVQEVLKGADLQGALLGMGSTYRCIGEYQKAKETFKRAQMKWEVKGTDEL
jgi:hypothetical protein